MHDDSWVLEDGVSYGDNHAESPSFLYVLLAEGTSLVKVGYASDLEARRKALQSGCPYPLRVLVAIPCTNAAHVERLLHAHWSARRFHRE